jgi:hypothetical protein
MNFDEKYRLLDLAEDEEAKTFIACQISTGQQINVFLFIGEQARMHGELIEQLRTADNKQFPELIETGINQGTQYVVTKPLGGFQELKMRASQIKRDAVSIDKPKDFSRANAPALTQQQTQPAALKNLGDKTVDAESASMTQINPPATHLPSPEVQPQVKMIPVVPLAEPLRAEKDSEDFSQIFQSPAAPMGEQDVKIPAPAVSVAPPSAPLKEKKAPGEFTQMFHRPVAPMGEPDFNKPAPAGFAPPSPEPPQMKKSPGEFTQMFRSPMAPSGEPHPKVPTPSMPISTAPAPSQSEAGPGEFTRMFRSPLAPKSDADFKTPTLSRPLSAAPPKTDTGPGEFTRFFHSSSLASGPAPASKKADNGEFTKVFGGGAMPPGQYENLGNSAGSGSFTQIFNPAPSNAPVTNTSGAESSFSPAAYTPPGASVSVGASPQFQTQAAEPQKPGAPGEYTQMFGVQSMSPVVTSEPAPGAKPVAEAPAPAKSRSKMPLIMAGIILVLLVVIAVVIFALSDSP